MRAVFCLLVLAPIGVLALQNASGSDESKQLSEFTNLEREWNEAHLGGNAEVLDRLWADELIVTVPEMAPMDRAQSLQIWRSGKFKFKRYETSEIRVRVFGDAAVVTGRLLRSRTMQGRDIQDNWRFTKVYVRRDSKWLVVAWHASKAEG